MAARTLEELQKQYGGQSSDPKKGMMRGHGPRRGGGPGVRAKGKPKDTKATVKRLLSYISKYKFRLILVLMCMLFSTISSLTGSYILKLVIDAFEKGATEFVFLGIVFDQPLEYLALILTVVSCIYICGIVASYLQARLMLSVSMNAIENLRNDLFKKVQKLPVRAFDSDSNGTIMSSFTNDIDNIDMRLHNTVVNLISGTITIIGTLSIMIFTNILNKRVM